MPVERLFSLGLRLVLDLPREWLEGVTLDAPPPLASGAVDVPLEEGWSSAEEGLWWVEMGVEVAVGKGPPGGGGGETQKT